MTVCLPWSPWRFQAHTFIPSRDPLDFLSSIMVVLRTLASLSACCVPGTMLSSSPI